MLHQFIFWLCQEKAVPLHKIFINQFAMRKSFKVISRLLQVAFVVLLFDSCGPGPDINLDSPPFRVFDPYVGGISSSVQDEDRERVFRDTITPPSNPMNELPYVPGTFYFRGVLKLEYYNGSLFCAIRSTNNSNYFLTDNGSKYLLRLDCPLLKDFAVGDTLVLTAVPMMLIDSFSLATYHIVPNAIFK